MGHWRRRVLISAKAEEILQKENWSALDRAANTGGS